MTTKFSTPSKRYRMEHGPYVSWFLNGQWVKFRILSNEDVGMPKESDLIGHAISDDHLEELYQCGDQFYRHAGGGRGFYWTQELRVEDESFADAYYKKQAEIGGP